MRRTVVLILALVAFVPLPGRAGIPVVVDHARLAGTILPPGTDAAHAVSEVRPYETLAFAYETLTEDTLFRYFKQAGFGADGPVIREYSPRPGVLVQRDERWGVPHVYGDTDADAWFGAGYVSAEDRLPIMDLLRALGRGEAFELLGTTPAWFADAEMMRLYGYTEEEFQDQLERLPRLYGDEGKEILTAIREFVDGVNDFIARIYRGEAPLPDGYTEIGRLPAPWRETDIVAVTTVIRALFGAGGGTELSNAVVLAELEQDHGAAQARAIYEDFRNRDNRDGPTHVQQAFPYMTYVPAAIDSAANVRAAGSGKPGIQVTLEEVASHLPMPQARTASIDELRRLDDASRIDWDRLNLSTPLGAIDLRPKGMSNALVIGAGRSENGRPMLLGGPQTGYFSPEVLLELDLHGDRVHARGAAFPGVSMFVLLGRSASAAWTATAGGGDMIDTRIELLCEPDGAPVTEHSTSYLYKERCLPMDRRVHRSLPAAPVPGGSGRLPDIISERTIHGPVVGRGTVGAAPVAVVRQRSTYGREVDAALPFLRLNRDQVRTGADFTAVMPHVNLSTNWLFAGRGDIAYVAGGLYPRRPASVDPDLPVWGTGEWEWDGFLSFAEHPQVVNPASGYLTSWNNRPAPGWSAGDEKWGWSSLYRADMLDDRIASDSAITPVELVAMMEDAGLTDFRGSHVLPLALRILESATGVGAREQQMIAMLGDWLAAGTRRLDSDEDGAYEHQATIAIMDAWWEPMIRAVFDPVVGDAARFGKGFDNAPNSGGSAYQDGFYGQMWTEFSQVLGDPVLSPTSRVYCGALAACATKLLASLEAAGDALAASQGTDDPSRWTVDAELERIRFLPGAAISMHWVNRPTFQQITQFEE